MSCGVMEFCIKDTDICRKDTDICRKDTDLCGKDADICGKDTDLCMKDRDIPVKNKINHKDSKAQRSQSFILDFLLLGVLCVSVTLW